LSYLDILAISAVTPAVFVSKAEVRRWPLFGWFAAIAGTVFVDRERRTHVGEVNREIETALAAARSW
jgi:1-acyl-sn-glycerol-3-phosphate acyltransferase